MIFCTDKDIFLKGITWNLNTKCLISLYFAWFTDQNIYYHQTPADKLSEHWACANTGSEKTSNLTLYFYLYFSSSSLFEDLDLVDCCYSIWDNFHLVDLGVVCDLFGLDGRSECWDGLFFWHGGRWSKTVWSVCHGDVGGGYVPAGGTGGRFRPVGAKANIPRSKTYVTSWQEPRKPQECPPEGLPRGSSWPPRLLGCPPRPRDTGGKLERKNNIR